MNVERRWLGTSAVRVRVLAAGLVLLGAGCAVLGWGSRSRQTAANAAAEFPTTEERTTLGLMKTAQALPTDASREAKSRASSLLAGLPLIFEPNQGQGNLDPADPRAKFVTRGTGYSLFLGSEGAILSLVSRDDSRKDVSRQDTSKQDSAKRRSSATRVESLQMKLAGANPLANVRGAGRLPGTSNYFLGNDPAKWRHGVPQFARVRYENVYPGINLVFYGNQGRLEYDFQVAPGADAAQAELEFDGAKKLELKDGALVIEGEAGSVQFAAPRVYQEIAGRQQAVEGSFVLRGANRAGFAIGSYDHARELVIDPILTFSTYFGGSGDELSTFVAVDSAFDIYITGSTTSPNLPVTAGVKQLTLNGTQNAYVAKITPPLGQTPAVLNFVTYLGGDGTDYPVGISVDGRGDPFVAGTTTSDNFPTTSTNAYQPTPETGAPAGTPHVFVTELLFDASTLQYSSYLSGNGTDIASGMTLDASGNIYVTGTTTSSIVNTTDQFPASTLPYAQPFQPLSKAAPGLAQFFVTKVNTSASRAGSIAYSTYFGGGTFVPVLPPPAPQTPTVVGGGIAVDTSGIIYFTGTTNYTYTGFSSSSDFPILNPYQPCLDQPPPAVIVSPPQCTYATPPAASDAFVAKLNPNAVQGQQLIWSTYVGGTGADLGNGIALDSGAVNVYIVGTTNSIDIGQSAITLSTSTPFQRCLDNLFDPATKACTAAAGAPNDAFVARLSNPTTTTGAIPVNVALNYFSYLGGSLDEAGTAITVDSGAGALVTGWTQSTDFPVFPPAAPPIQGALNGPRDAFIARLNTTTTAAGGQTTAASWATYFGGNNIDEGTGITLDVNQGIYVSGDTNSTALLPLAKPLEGTNNGGYDAFVAQLQPRYILQITGALTLGTNQTFISAGNQATFTYTVTNSGPDLASNLTLTDNLSQAYTQVKLGFVSASVNAGTCGGGSTGVNVSCSLPPLQAGSIATVTIVVTPTPNSSGNQATFNGGTVQVMGPGNIVLAQTTVPAEMSDFSLNVSPNNASVQAAGDTATYQVQLTPHPIYATAVALGCTGLPTGAACNFTNQSVNLQGPGSSTLNITTTARPIVTPAASLLTRHFYAMWLAVPGLALLGVGVGGGRRRRRILGILMFCALFGLLFLQPACSTTNTQPPVSGTPAGVYQITVNATSGSDTKNQFVSLQVP